MKHSMYSKSSLPIQIKTKPILDILLRNKEKLISFLNNFRNDKEDEQFNEEKVFLLKQIAQLQPAA